MGKIFAPPSNLSVPSLDLCLDKDGYKKYEEAYAKFMQELQAICKKAHPNCPEAGEVIRFPVADGYAEYMVFSLKPVQLIHIPIGDAWEHPYVHRLTAKDIRTEVERNKAMSQIFGGQ